jgi:hypothetical protein
MCSNPTKNSGYFYNTQHGKSGVWKTFRFSSIDSPFVSEQFVKDMAAEYGEDHDVYRVRVMGQFPSASITQLIPVHLVNKGFAQNYNQGQYHFAPKILGVDVAWEGDDRSCVVFRQGLFSEVLLIENKIDNMGLASVVARYIDKFSVDSCFIDVGWGTGVIDRLRQLGYSPLPVNFGGKSGSDRYANKVTEMWVKLKEWLEEGGQLPKSNKDALQDDLISRDYFFTTAGKIQLESKKDMKRRGLRSPDIGDALALTFAENVVKSEKKGLFGGLFKKQKTEYDVWNV